MRRVAAAAMAFAVLAACGGEAEEPAERTPGPTASEPPTTEPADTDGTPLGVAEVSLREVARFPQPLAMVPRTGAEDDLYVAGKGGQVGVLRGDAASAEPVLDLSAEISTGSEQGLLGIAFSADGSTLYVSYTDRSGDSRLVQYAVDDDGAVDEASRRTLLSVAQPAANHNGGHVLLGPDGYLWYGLGDGGGGGDQFGNAQDTGTLLGSILRIDPRPTEQQGYAIPDDNPFADGGGRPEIAVYGARNPWRFSFDRDTDDLWIGDVGQGEIEEVDLLPAGRILGANLGWPFLEGTRPYREEEPPVDVVDPVFEYTHDQGRSIVGGFVYRGDDIPALRGAYLFADTYTARVRAISVEGGRTVAERDLDLPVPGGLVSSFAEDADGELYVLSLDGGIHRLESG